MNHNEQNPNDHNQTSDLESSLVIVEQLSTRPDEPEAQQGSISGSIGREAWHEVRVEVRRPLLQTIVRPGYYR